jgi:parallel beta-helix repeat protein
MQAREFQLTRGERQVNELIKQVRPSMASTLATIICVASTSVFATSGELDITANTKLKEDHAGVIVIAADGVTLNCNGHQVNAQGEQAAISMFQRNGVTIKNCTATGAAVGISVVLSSDVVVKGNLAIWNTTTGMFFNNSEDLTIKYNVATKNGVEGFDVQFVTDSVVHDNLASDNNLFGFTISYATDSLFKDNAASDNVAFGFYLYSSTGNLLKHNSACGHQEDLRSGPTESDSISGLLSGCPAG